MVGRGTHGTSNRVVEVYGRSRASRGFTGVKLKKYVSDHKGNVSFIVRQNADCSVYHKAHCLQGVARACLK